MKSWLVKNLISVQILTVFLIFVLCPEASLAQKILIYMDDKQSDHLRAYGVAYWTLEQGEKVEWLLNYRGGSFLTNHSQAVEDRCNLEGVSYTVIDFVHLPQVLKLLISISLTRNINSKWRRAGVYVPPN